MLPSPAILPDPSREFSMQPSLSRRARQAGGQPIGELMHAALTNPELISLAAGFVDNGSLPLEPTRAAMEALLASPRAGQAALQYGTTPGNPRLRELVLERLRAADGRTAAEDNLSIDNVLITAGSNQLLHHLADTLCDPGDIVLCATPTYFVFLGVLANLGVRAVGVESDGDGIVPEALDAELARLDAAGDLPCVKAIYVVSHFDNPGGVTLSAERRPQVVEIARRWSRGQAIYILDDAAYRPLRYEGRDLPGLRAYDEAGDTVVTCETFSKCYSPGVRVGWGIVPTPLVEPLLAQKVNFDFGSPHFTQCLMATVLDRGLLDPHVERLRAAYRPKREAMLAALKEHFGRMPGASWVRPQGGLYVWLSLPEHVDTGPRGKLWRRAMHEGVLYVPGEYCYPAEGVPAARHQMRLSFGVQGPEEIARGIAALRRAVDAQSEPRP